MTRGPEPDGAPVHVPVLLEEVLEHLEPRPGGVYIDTTLGGGGHAAAILERVGAGGRLLGIDRDAETLEATRRRLGDDPRVVTVHADYRDLPAVLEDAGLGRADGLLADLGVSSLQLDGPGRGFSMRRDEPLDMRMDRSRGITAAQWLASTDEAAMERALHEWGEERFARRIARAIARRRDASPLRTTGELADLVRGALPAGPPARIHPATRTFQAVRIAVNDELRGLERFVEDAVEGVKDGGRVVFISFHSLEDRPVKRTLRRLEGECVCPPDLPVCGCNPLHRVRVRTRRAVRPSEDEVARNPRARSARLRAAERLAAAEAAA